MNMPQAGELNFWWSRNVCRDLPRGEKTGAFFRPEVVCDVNIPQAGERNYAHVS